MVCDRPRTTTRRAERRIAAALGADHADRVGFRLRVVVSRFAAGFGKKEPRRACERFGTRGKRVGVRGERGGRAERCVEDTATRVVRLEAERGSP